MTKKMLTMMAALLLSGSAIAAPVDATSAKQKATAFLQKQAQRSNNSRRAAALRNPQLNEANAFGNALHVFNIGSDNGFVIVSGDDRTEEIVGYVENGSFGGTSPTRLTTISWRKIIPNGSITTTI